MTKTKFYYKIEPMRGYIPGDKLSLRGQAFEQSGWSIIVGEELTKEWHAIRYTHPMDNQKLGALFDKLSANVAEFIRTRPQENPKYKAFYLNFNADGIDCFISRWNWKPQN